MINKNANDIDFIIRSKYQWYYRAIWVCVSVSSSWKGEKQKARAKRNKGIEERAKNALNSQSSGIFAILRYFVYIDMFIEQ